MNKNMLNKTKALHKSISKVQGIIGYQGYTELCTYKKNKKSVSKLTFNFIRTKKKINWGFLSYRFRKATNYFFLFNKHN